MPNEGSPSVRRRIGEALLIITIPISLYLGALVHDYTNRGAGGEDLRQDALFDAAWIVEQAIQFQKIRNTNPGSIGTIQSASPRAYIESTDPWWREWIVSPAFQDTRTPSNTGDLWMCSRGPRGNGRCPPEDFSAAAATSHGAVGYSAEFGGWSSPTEITWQQWIGDGLALALAIAPLPAYVASRVIRRARGHPAPRITGSLGCLVVILVVVPVAAFLGEFYGNIQSVAWTSRAQGDVRTLSAAIDEYRTHMGSTPATLDDLTAPAFNAQGRGRDPFIAAIPEAPCCGGRYRYRRWSDGRRYLVLWTDRGNRVLPSGSRERMPSVFGGGSTTAEVTQPAVRP